MTAGDRKTVVLSTEAPVRHALLDAAEQMFAQFGFDGVSLRELTCRAGTNLGAVNYHFGSKEKLFEEVFVRRVRPVNERRLVLLDAAVNEVPEGRPRLSAVLEAFARPFVVGTAKAQRDTLRRMAVRFFMEMDPLVKPIFEREILPVVKTFREALIKACPELSPRQLDMGMMFYGGAMVNLLASEKRIAMFRHAARSPGGDEETLRALVQFGVAGFAGLAAGRAAELSTRSKR